MTHDERTLSSGGATDEIISAAEAAALLKISPATLRRWSASGDLPSLRTPGGHRRYRREDLDAFAHRSPQTSTGERWGELLLDVKLRPLTLRALLEQERAALGSWWAVSERILFPAALELFRRSDAGHLGVLERQCAFTKLDGVLIRILEGASADSPRRSLLLAAAPGDRSQAPLARIALCTAEEGWAHRWAGQGTPDEIVQFCAAERVHGVVVSASLAMDEEALAPWSAGFGKLHERLGVPVLLVGPWPRDEIDGADAAAQGVGGVRTWVHRLAAQLDGSQRR